MKICVTAQATTLDAQVDPRFGRCLYFIIVDSDTRAFEAFANPAPAGGGGAGIEAGRFISEKKADVVLTGNVGPNAFQTLSAAGITVITKVSGTVSEALERYRKGEYSPTAAASVDAHAGMQ
ncbi:MAG TPA: dinitrogenase iron-molybdenum cofactor biosynthesis protein [Spirochaetia bacterium]|nr:dinitrogenase iron-molybdenum cofactor biosynthesis protein [Spirochaetia bacterium]